MTLPKQRLRDPTTLLETILDRVLGEKEFQEAFPQLPPNNGPSFVQQVLASSCCVPGTVLGADIQ